MKPHSLIFRTAAALFGLLILLICLLPYILDARYRSGAREWKDWEWKHDQSTKDGGKYSTKMAVFKDKAYLQLYETETGELLADRLYSHGDILRLLWKKDRLIYSTVEDTLLYDGGIKLPPTQLDKLLTYLP